MYKNLVSILPFLSLSRYYDQLCAVEPKFPFSENQVSDRTAHLGYTYSRTEELEHNASLFPQLCLTFTWKDAFDKGSLFGGSVKLGTCNPDCLGGHVVEKFLQRCILKIVSANVGLCLQWYMSFILSLIVSMLQSFALCVCLRLSRPQKTNNNQRFLK